MIKPRIGKVTATIPVTGITHGIAADPRTDTLYVSGASHAGIVSVINGRTRKVTATVKVGNNPLGIAVDPSASTVYVANEMDGTVSVLGP